MKTIFILLLTQILLIKTQNDCAWVDPRGLIYNLTSIDKPDAWKIQDNSKTEQQMFSMVYVFNFCDFTNVLCHRKKVAAFEALSVMGQVTDNCDIAGQPYNKTVSYLNAEQPDAGIQVEFQEGDLCVELDSEVKLIYQLNLDQNEQVQDAPMKPRSILFQIQCPENGINDDTWTIIQSLGCKDVLRIKHNLGCKPGTNSGISFLTVSLIVLVLILLKCCHNYYNGLSGQDAIPLILLLPWQFMFKFISKSNTYSNV